MPLTHVYESQGNSCLPLKPAGNKSRKSERTNKEFNVSFFTVAKPPFKGPELQIHKIAKLFSFAKVHFDSLTSLDVYRFLVFFYCEFIAFFKGCV